MSEKLDFDVAVLGGGSAGYAAARTAAGAGLKSVVIEGADELGGLCILRGCMPTKALLYISEVLHLAKNAGPFGVRVHKAGLDFKRAMARKNALIREFAENRARQLQAGTFKFIRARARFLDAHTVALTPRQGRECHSARAAAEKMQDGAQGTDAPCKPRRLSAKHFVLATGSAVAPPPLPSLSEAGYLTSDDALALERPPESLLVLGGGPTACEFAQFFARVGVKVTLVQRSGRVLMEFDADAATEIERVFRREGIQVFTGTRLLDAKRKAKLKVVSFERGSKTAAVSAAEILFALGRVPNTTSLDLGKAGVQTERDRIVADEFMQTSAPHIYAAGDCTGPHEIVHIAVQQGEIAAHNIAHPDARRAMDGRLLAEVVFTEPQIAFVGLTEKEAAARGLPFLAASYPFNDHGKSLIMEAKDGFVKLLADPKSGEILGGSCVGPLGGELIHEIVAAMAKRMTVHELAAMPHYHPTLAEIWTYPAEELAAKIPWR
ncbi:MAG: NAD(P)/FAD-dependent oxidoreductase [Verrucomicrobiota bacterium]|nr:NAD(P)/FAD-dependent oxidoreductase [Verrucomicrobiota bacterium]